MHRQWSQYSNNATKELGSSGHLQHARDCHPPFSVTVLPTSWSYYHDGGWAWVLYQERGDITKADFHQQNSAASVASPPPPSNHAKRVIVSPARGGELVTRGGGRTEQWAGVSVLSPALSSPHLLRKNRSLRLQPSLPSQCPAVVQLRRIHRIQQALHCRRWIHRGNWQKYTEKPVRLAIGSLCLIK